jgi:hypothetical protein
MRFGRASNIPRQPLDVDVAQGYHQIGVKQESQEKLAFAGPDATKWTYNVMPFGPVNGPATFIAFIHNVNSTWKAVAQSYSVVINNSMNTTGLNHIILP